jgi:hypothetical protein
VLSATVLHPALSRFPLVARPGCSRELAQRPAADARIRVAVPERFLSKARRSQSRLTPSRARDRRSLRWSGSGRCLGSALWSESMRDPTTSESARDRHRHSLSDERAIWYIVLRYTEATSLGKLSPHDLRRTCAKLCRKGITREFAALRHGPESLPYIYVCPPPAPTLRCTAAED